MKITNIRILKKQKVSNNLFTGNVSLKVPFEDIDDKDTTISYVHFSKGVANKLHKHSTDQVLIVTEGQGFIATENEKYVVKEGDIIWTPAGQIHKHGAMPGNTFTHISITKSNSKLTQVED